jgi:hypothetical protein
MIHSVNAPDTNSSCHLTVALLSTENQFSQILHVAINAAADDAQGGVWQQRPSIFKGTKIKITWREFMHLALYVATKQQSVLRQHLPFHHGCSQDHGTTKHSSGKHGATKHSGAKSKPAAAAFVSKVLLATLHAFRSWRDRMDPLRKNSPGMAAADTAEGPLSKLGFADVITGFVRWRESHQFDPAGDRQWAEDQPPLHFCWWLAKGPKLRAKVARALKAGLDMDDGAIAGEFERVVNGQLLPAIARAITAALVIAHIDSAGEAVDRYNQMLKRTLRLVQRTKPAGAMN